MTPSPVMRVNKRDGGVDIIPLARDDWIRFDEAFPSEAHDIAVHDMVDLGPFEFAAVPADSFILESDITAYSIGPGDDVYMVGMYIDQDGIQRNRPSARFGNISLMPGETLLNQDGYEEESFIVEMRSLAGYSGSPVWVTLRPFTMTVTSDLLGSPYTPRQNMTERLLGIQWSQPPSRQYTLMRVGMCMSSRA